MDTIQKGLGSLGPGEEDRMIALLRDVRSLIPPLPMAEIERLLDATASCRLRNAAALALVDLEARQAGERIGELLSHPDVALQSGTLLFALDELGGRLPFGSFVNIVRNGSFEGRSEALHFLDEDRIEPDPDAGHLLMDQLVSIVAGPDPEAAQVAQDALTILSGRIGRPEAARQVR